MLVTRVAYRDDPEANNLLETRTGVAEKLIGRLVEIGGTLVEVEFAAFKKQMRVRVNEAGQQSVFGKVGIGRLLIRAQRLPGWCGFADVENLLAVVDDVRIL